MKKIFAIFTIATIFSISANAEVVRDRSQARINNREDLRNMREGRISDRSVGAEARKDDRTRYHMNSRREGRENRLDEQMSDNLKVAQDRIQGAQDRIHEHKDMMHKLTPAQREEAKREMKRHRREMKRITGFDLPMMPGHENVMNDRHRGEEVRENREDRRDARREIRADNRDSENYQKRRAYREKRGENRSDRRNYREDAAIAAH